MIQRSAQILKKPKIFVGWSPGVTSKVDFNRTVDDFVFQPGFING